MEIELLKLSRLFVYCLPADLIECTVISHRNFLQFAYHLQSYSTNSATLYIEKALN